MTTSKALEIIFQCADFAFDYDVDEAMAHITNQLGMVFEEETQQWVTADTGDVV